MGWLSGWAKRRKITIDHGKIDNDLTDFPILIYLSSNSGINNTDVTSIFDEVGSNRKKIAVTTSDGETQCYVEIEKWDAVNEEAWLWVKVPNISATEDTILYIYYDNTQPDNTDYVGDPGETPAQQVWSNGFVAVYHLNRDPSGTAPQEIDSTGNGHDGTSQGSMTSDDLVSGKINDALDFDGSDDMITIPDDPALESFSQATLEAWIKMDINSRDQFFLCKQAAHKLSGTYKILFDYSAYQSGRSKVISIWGNNVRVEGLTENLAIGTWYYVVGWTYGSTTKIFLNGVEDGSASGNAFYQVDSETVKIGGGESGSYFDGIIDEVRISNAARSTAWIKATYETNRDNLLTWGSEQTAAAWRKLQYYTEPPSAGWNKLKYATEPPVAGAWNKLLYEGE